MDGVDEMLVFEADAQAMQEYDEPDYDAEMAAMEAMEAEAANTLPITTQTVGGARASDSSAMTQAFTAPTVPTVPFTSGSPSSSSAMVPPPARAIDVPTVASAAKPVTARVADRVVPAAPKQPKLEQAAPPPVKKVLTPDEQARLLAGKYAKPTSDSVAQKRASARNGGKPGAGAGHSSSSGGAAAGAQEQQQPQEDASAYLSDRPGRFDGGDYEIKVGHNLLYLPRRPEYSFDTSNSTVKYGSGSGSDLGLELGATGVGGLSGSEQIDQMLAEITATNADNILAKMVRSDALLLQLADSNKAHILDANDNEAEAASSNTDPNKRNRSAKIDEDDDDDVVVRQSSEKVAAQDASEQPRLWASRYHPRSFVDLLSPDDINRDVLKWIKQWDGSVFGTNSGSGGGFGNGGNAGGIVKQSFVGAGAGAGGFRGGRGGGGGGGGGGYNHNERNGNNSGHNGGGIGGYSGNNDRNGGNNNSGNGGNYNNNRGYNNNSSYSNGGGGYSSYYRSSPVLLLCGPPGTGKTTLAHIAAKQAGYRTVEVNASDERNGKGLRDLISAAQGMKPVFGDKRPVLVVLDEIDGMDGGPSGGVAELVRMIKATNKAIAIARRKARNGENDDDGNERSNKATKNEDGDDSDGDDEMDGGDDDGGNNGEGGANGAGAGARAGKGKGKGKRKGNDADGSGGSDDALVLTRPLVCICNDVYASVLRELRPLVQIVEFRPTPSDRLAVRVTEICKAEGISITKDAVISLVKLTNQDIRGCLNTLQFIKAQNALGNKQRELATGISHKSMAASWSRIRVTADTIEKAAVGSKDETRALMEVWAGVYAESGPLAPARGSHMTAASTNSSGLHDPVAMIWQQAGAYGSDAGILLSGLHENLLQVKISDSFMRKTTAALDYLCYGQELLSKMMSTQVHGLTKYIPLTAAGIHLQCASDIKMKPSWPRAEAAMRYKQESRENILTTFMHGRATAPGSHPGAGALDRGALITDVLSPLLTIVSPAMRPVNFSLLNSREQQDLKALIEVLCSNGLEYASTWMASAHKQGFDNQADRRMSLQPNIGSLLSFEGCDPYDGEIRSSQLPDLLKEMLSHELRLARLRLSRSNASTAASTDAGTAASPASKLAPVELPEHVKRLLAGVDGPVIAPSAAAGAGSAMAIDGDAAAGVPDADAVVVKRDFLQAAAERSRELQMERKRKAVMMDGPAGAAASAASSVPASSDAASGKRASGGPAAAVAGAGAAAAAATAAEKAAGAGAPVTGGQQQQKYPAVFYRYQEGFTNAVKRSLKIADFFK